ncbi:SdrD B-like domain-containing protein [Okeania sp. KiyG1]|uniref:SdrD B-like domain-containing protein n=1 Tax=Okeania sp. KiyG1 TaxID=2720165 RepID=UPI001F3E0F05|nr:SdrD B-like domain-containing protein [Okeania sp. KiyG1]
MYQFNNINLAPGTYSIRDISPTGFTQQQPAPTITINPTDTIVNLTQVDLTNIANNIPANISGTKLNDTNNDGIGDTPAPNITIYIDTNNNNILDNNEIQTTTDINGLYQFNNINLAPGTYSIRDISPTGFTQQQPAPTITINPTDTIVNLTQVDLTNIANNIPANISGTKLNDTNNDGIGDTPAPNITIYIDTNNNNILDNNEIQTITDINGLYQFNNINLAPGTYSIRDIPPTGFTQQQPAPTITINPTDTIVNLTQVDLTNIANNIPANISGTKLNDTNNDGIGDTPAPNITIYIDTNNNNILDNNEIQTITDINGLYQFNNINLAPGTYSIRDIPPTGFTQQQPAPTITINPTDTTFDFSQINLTNIPNNITPPGISITQTGGSTDVIEGSTTDTYQIELDSNPSDPVNITITSEGQALLSDSDETLSNTINLTFNPGNLGAQTITVTAVDDNIAAGDSIDNIIHTATSNDQNYNGPTAPFTVDGTPSNVITANITDNDIPNVVINPATTDATEGGATGSYQVFLTTEPIGNVSINFNTDQQIQPIAPITFDQTNWNVPRTVTVTAVDDNIPETETQNISTIAHQAFSQTDLRYNNLNISQVTVNIDDPAPTQVLINQTDGNTAFTAGGSDNYTIQLNSNPTTPIEIAIAPPLEINLGSGPGVPITLEFNESNGTTPQNVTVTGVNDGNFNISHSATLDGIDPNLQFIVDGVPTNIVNANVTSQSQPLGNISGTVFDDLNNNDSPDPTEGIGNITVFIDSNNNNILDPNERNTLTNLDGNYNFSELEANTYNIRAVPQGNFIPELIAPVPLLAGQNATNINIQNNISPGSISGNIFNDINLNGLFDSGETGLGDITVFLDTNQNDTLDPNEQQATRNGFGFYSFSNLLPGNYTVRTISPQPNATLTTAAEFPVSLSSSQNVNDINFGYSIANSGTLQFSEPTFNVAENTPTATVTITRTDGSDGVVSANINLSSDTAVQGVDFGNPFPNPIFFADGETQQTVSIPIFDNSIVEGNKTVNLSLSNVTGDGTIGQPATAILEIREDEVPLPPIANPDTANITQGDPPITINVLANDQGDFPEIIAVDNFSQAGNNVTIDGINNQIIYSLAPGFTTTEPFTDTFNYTISDNNPNTPDSTNTVSVVVNPQPEFPGSISGNIFNDINRNGLFDSGETGLGDITVFLDINQNDTLDPNEQQATRNGFGFYSFSNLLPGNYTVRTISPQPNATLTTAAEFPVSLSSSQDVNVNFGYSIANSGTLQFSNPTFSVTENEPTATVTVIRTGGSDGVVSANFNLSNGTASQGIDYGNPVPETIFFTDDQTQQTINIPIVNDDSVENTETVNLSLSNVTGGATVGSPATLQIIDDDELLPPPQPFITRVLRFDGEFNNFDSVRSVPVTSPQGPPDLLFSRNTVALVSRNEPEGEGRFDGTPNNNTVIAYDIPDQQLGFELDAIVIDLAEVIGTIGEIESGNLAFDYASPNRSHNVRFFNENSQEIGPGATLGPTTPVPDQPNNFSNFSRRSISIPGDTRFISIGSESTEIGIDNLQLTLQPEI